VLLELGPRPPFGRACAGTREPVPDAVQRHCAVAPRRGRHYERARAGTEIDERRAPVEAEAFEQLYLGGGVRLERRFAVVARDVRRIQVFGACASELVEQAFGSGHAVGDTSF
jgi:hypothetical protein